MVEFGLKLEDNKVSEWNEHYIQYDKLKAILNRASATVKKLDEYQLKRPILTQSIIQQYKRGDIISPYPSTNDLVAQDTNYVPNQQQENTSTASPTTALTTSSLSIRSSTLNTINEETNQIPQPQQLQQQQQQQQSLLISQSQRPSTYGSTDTTTTAATATAPSSPLPTSPSTGSTDTPPLSASQRNSLLSRVLDTASSNVSDYFHRNYVRTIRDLCKEIDAIAQEFDDCIQENIRRVNTFYYEQYNVLKGRIEYLKETVANVRQLGPTSSTQQQQQQQDEGKGDNIHNSSSSNMTKTTIDDDNDDRKETPLVQHRKSLTTFATLAAAKTYITKQIIPHHNRPPMPPSSSSLQQQMPSPQSQQAQKTLHHHRHRQSESNSDSSAFMALLIGGDDDDIQIDNDMENPSPDEAAKRREIESIRRALIDSYRTAKLLNNFAIMNYTGFVKIVKKYDKTFPKECRGRYTNDILPSNICDEGTSVDALATRMEILYSHWFCDKNISDARAQMMIKKSDGLEMDWSQLRLGYRMGMCTILSLWVCWDCIWGMVKDNETTIGGRTAFPIFRACGGLLTLQWCWGVSVWVWSRYRINYIYLFDFNSSIVASPLSIFNEAVDNTLFYLVSALLYYKAGAHDIPWPLPAGVFPFILLLYTGYQLIFPLRTRTPMWENVFQVIKAPTSSPTFFHGYVGDIFTSMVKIFQDLVWSIFFVVSGDFMISEDLPASAYHEWLRSTWYTNVLIPLVTLLPLWFRFNQCLRRYVDTGNRFPHLANAFKYALSQTVTLFGAFHPLYMRNQRESQIFQMFWMFAFVASSLYSFCWDLFMDWGLGRPKHGFLGPRLMFPKKEMYYSIICLDFVLRFAWVLTLLPPKSGAKFALPAYLTLVSMMLELFRRTIWGFLRLENEHRSNTAGFRRVDFVPLHFATGHSHGYKQEATHRGFSVLIEVVVVTTLVLGAAVVSVVAAQHATLRSSSEL